MCLALSSQSWERHRRRGATRRAPIVAAEQDHHFHRGHGRAADLSSQTTGLSCLTSVRLVLLETAGLRKAPPQQAPPPSPCTQARDAQLPLNLLSPPPRSLRVRQVLPLWARCPLVPHHLFLIQVPGGLEHTLARRAHRVPE